MNWPIILSVGAGGFIGATGRFLISAWIQKIAGVSFPVGTLGVNILGSFIIGFLFLLFEQTIAPSQKAFLITGMLGALTTFSTFSLETVTMIQNGMFAKSLVNIALNTTLCIMATLLGMALFKKLYG